VIKAQQKRAWEYRYARHLRLSPPCERDVVRAQERP